MEEGEIYPNDINVYANYERHRHDPPSTRDIDPSGATYSPSLEWPGGADPPSQPQYSDIAQTVVVSSHGQHASRSSAKQPDSLTGQTGACLRLLVQQSPVLSKKHRIAVLDGYTEVQFGRDVAPPGNDTPRIRLKEMAVSKLHATIYWDLQRREWAVVDMGSMHGTFLLTNVGSSVGNGASGGPGSVPAFQDSRGFRLSPPRIASIPRRLQHLDVLSFGDTSFIVHIHDRIPCADCSPRGNDEISLIDARRGERFDEASKKRKRDEPPANPSVVDPAARDPKKALTMLKRSLLSRHDSPPARAGSAEYVDRSARRRSLYPGTPPDAPGTASRSLLTSASPSPSLSDASTPKPEPVSAPPTPLSETNIGHRLLMKQGWQPGTSLGQPDSGGKNLVEPLNVHASVGRAGLGMSSAPASVPGSPGSAADWKESEKMKRWASVASGETESRQ